MGLVRRVAAVVVPLGLVVGGVWPTASPATRSGRRRHRSACARTKVDGLSVVLTATQARNASLIAAIAVRRGMPAHAATIALATALQESKLYNLRGGDRDSLGLFQQRPSQGWGTPREILDPVHATNAFYDALARVRRLRPLPVTVAAQRVQRSGYPSAYAVYEQRRASAGLGPHRLLPRCVRCHLTPRRRRLGSSRRLGGPRRCSARWRRPSDRSG